MRLNEVLPIAKQFRLIFTGPAEHRTSEKTLAQVLSLTIFTSAEKLTIDKLQVNDELKTQRARAEGKLKIVVLRLR